ncbi:tetratricopeptide repeat protein [Pararhizobium sp. IMCC21322]|uniref:O-linked N-acetylglucosamine transferase, SPINDLY family protein n=1 Tax=Pararhizobium sp. IMCC21322 TaxID=3067903 RepID=UPI0027429483|nr:tetratricopeptide repeat protein [Pararhizobium sp. IMCC21322]
MTDPAELFYQAIVYIEKKEFEKALSSLEACLKLAPDRASVRYNLASVLCQLGEFSRARQLADDLLREEPQNPDYLNLLASAIFPMGENARAISIYESLRENGDGSAETNLNLLNALVSTGELVKAESLISELKANNVPEKAYRTTLSILRFKQNRFDEALSLLDKILTINPSDTEALFQRGRLRSLRHNIDGAVKDFHALDACGERSARVRTYSFLAQQQAAAWGRFDEDVGFLAGFNENDEPNCPNPFICLLLPRTLDYEFRASVIAARTINESGQEEPHSVFAVPRHCNNEKIHVGYMSANYRRHPSAHNITKLIEQHDRSRFKIIGFDLFGENNSAERTRLKNAFDEFIDLSEKSDAEAGQIIRHLGVDILIDQMGHTARSRGRMFAQKNAPVQVSYLGFPGTSGINSIDYVIGDNTVIKADEERFYTEAVCYMPDTYWPAEGGVAVGAQTISRKQYGIPETAMVYCCFNTFQKITPIVFNRWMKILSNVSGSVLVLLDGPEIAKNNLKLEAEKRGVSGSRLIFIPKVSPEQHLARQSICDLFLDTSPYNAHTIGRDALLGGLPMITCIGNTFSDRVAASLLRASGLEELITTNGDAFVELGSQLGRDPAKLQHIKEKLHQNSQVHPLFDTPLFARYFERAFKEMNRRSLSGEPHTSFSVSEF